MSMKSMTMMPPMSRSRSCRAISSAASRLLRNTVSSRFDVPTFLPVLTSITVSASVCSMIERAARRQPHLAVERLVQLLVDVELLEERQLLGRGVVVLDAVGELGGDRVDVRLHLFVQRAVVDDDAAVLLGELLADHPDRERRLLVEQRRPASPSWRARRSAPTARRGAAHVALELFVGGALGGGAHDQAVLGRAAPGRGSRRSRLRSSSGRRFEMP